MELHLKSKNEFLVEIFHRYFEFSELAVKKVQSFTTSDYMTQKKGPKFYNFGTP